ncbi:tetratricopeptide repeat protein [Marinicella rhabdoformis]|uniref:tetratricopeptide repeat protein n=1 Tax=Marinicella rhabdoformis TaxID=2580566 RepID=UPI0012AEBECC|nr:hypothetical protein [Marinicella rhabdoformis]
MKKLGLLLYLLLCVITAQAAEESVSDVDYLELASLMLKDGNLDRATQALSQVDLSEEGINVQRFYVLTGLLSVRQAKHQEAIDAFTQAKQAGPVDSVINVYLAQAAYSIQNYALVIESLDSAGTAVERIPSVYHMRAQSHWLMKQHAMALAVMDQASLVFPEESGFMRRKIFYLIELGMNSTAAELGADYLTRYNAEASDYVAIGNALRQSDKGTGDLNMALQFLEKARLMFPQNADVAKSLAAAYIKNEAYHSAAKIVHDLALTDNGLISEAAELYRRAGQLFMALTLNGLIEDQEQKLTQRLALLIELENFEQAAAMEQDILRVRIDQDENIKYALAYALFKVGNYRQSEHYLGQITDTQLFQKTVEIRKIIADCEAESWRC